MHVRTLDILDKYVPISVCPKQSQELMLPNIRFPPSAETKVMHGNTSKEGKPCFKVVLGKFKTHKQNPSSEYQ
jgi:hypothetical protein